MRKDDIPWGFKYAGINVLGGNNVLAIYSSCAGLLSLILELVAFGPNAFRSGSGQPGQTS